MDSPGGALLAHVWSWPFVAAALTVILVVVIIAMLMEDDIPSIVVDTKLSELHSRWPAFSGSRMPATCTELADRYM